MEPNFAHDFHDFALAPSKVVFFWVFCQKLAKILKLAIFADFGQNRPKTGDFRRGAFNAPPGALQSEIAPGAFRVKK